MSERRALASFDPNRLIAVLDAHHVRYILIGALGARLQGFPRLTADADITPSRDEENLGHLAAALRELHARVYTESVPEGLAFDFTGKTLARNEMWNLVTSAGRLDIAFVPAGTTGYEDLKRTAITYDIDGATIEVASLEDIVRSKRAADRPQDRQDIAVMLELIARRASE